jgi:hypothetical protein
VAKVGEPESTKSIAVFAEFLSDPFDHLAEFPILVAKLFELLLDGIEASIWANEASIWANEAGFRASPLWSYSLGPISALLISLRLLALWLIALWLILGTTHLLCHLLFGVPQILLDVIGSPH